MPESANPVSINRVTLQNDPIFRPIFQAECPDGQSAQGYWMTSFPAMAATRRDMISHCREYYRAAQMTRLLNNSRLAW